MKVTREFVVDWFDALKGIGETVSTNGHTVWLMSNNIIDQGRFLTLKKGEKISCEVDLWFEYPVAKNIQRGAK